MSRRRNSLSGWPFLQRFSCVIVFSSLFYCQIPIESPNTDSDYTEFESVWQWCKALSIYQDSSAFEGRIPSDPFVFSNPEDIMLFIHDTLGGNSYYNHYTRYDVQVGLSPAAQLNSAALAIKGAQAAYFSSLVLSNPIVATSTVILDSLTASTALLTILTFDSLNVDSNFQICASAASRFPNMVINLRNNRGGYIDQAVSIMGAFGPAGTPYIQVRQRDYDTVTKKFVTLDWYQWTTTQSLVSGLENKRLAVLMNDTTASASEIMAAGLYEGRNALLIGSQSYGKGMGQSLVVRRVRKPLLITSILLKGISPRIGDYHRKGIVPDTIPQAIKQQGDSLYSDDWHRQIFYAVKMLDSTALPGSIDYPAEHHPAPASLRKAVPCYYKIISEDVPYK
jgi:hypothetical protein